MGQAEEGDLQRPADGARTVGDDDGEGGEQGKADQSDEDANRSQRKEAGDEKKADGDEGKAGGDEGKADGNEEKAEGDEEKADGNEGKADREGGKADGGPNTEEGRRHAVVEAIETSVPVPSLEPSPSLEPPPKATLPLANQLPAALPPPAAFGRNEFRPGAGNVPPLSQAVAPALTRPTPPAATTYILKEVHWPVENVGVRRLKIFLQNENGPCPLLALCNVLLLRGDIEIRPFDRQTLTYDHVAELLGDYLLRSMPEGGEASLNASPTASEPSLASDSARLRLLTYRHNLTTALSTLPLLQRGLDVNVGFDNLDSFEPTPELAVFDAFRTRLVHGWVVDPTEENGKTWEVMVARCKTYNGAVETVVRGTEVAGLQFSPDGTIATTSSTDPLHLEQAQGSVSPEEKARVADDAIHASRFLNSTATQLTYHGLSQLGSELPDHSLCVFFRNNHFSVLFKRAPGELYTLVTDAGFADENSVMWESLRDIDQGRSQFVDAFFRPVGHYPQAPAASPSGENSGWTGEAHVDEDYALALSLQEDENERERQHRQRELRERAPEQVTTEPRAQGRQPADRPTGITAAEQPSQVTARPAAKATSAPRKKFSECLVM